MFGRPQWPRGLRRWSAAARLLRSWVRIPPGAWMFVCCECCVLSGRGLCDEVITRPEESYRLWCVVVCDLLTSRMRRPWPALGLSATEKKTSCVWLISSSFVIVSNTTGMAYLNTLCFFFNSTSCTGGVVWTKTANIFLGPFDLHLAMNEHTPLRDTCTIGFCWP